MTRSFVSLAAAAIAFGSLAAPLEALVPVTLKGSRASMERQNELARSLEYDFVANERDVNRLTTVGELVPVSDTDTYRLANVSFPYARPEVHLFLERLSAGYMESCGEALVITSLTRPSSRQPSNAHALSVHPTGMAVDLRIPSNPTCLAWLSDALLGHEDDGLLDVTREYRPPHFHVALFTEVYGAHVTAFLADSLGNLPPSPAPSPGVASLSAPQETAPGISSVPEDRENASLATWLLWGVAGAVWLTLWVRASRPPKRSAAVRSGDESSEAAVHQDVPLAA